MHFLVVGPGAMGCLFSARLKAAGNDVTLLDHREDRARLLSEKGIRLEGLSGDLRVSLPVVSGPPARTPEVVLICVKATQTGPVASSLSGWLPEPAVVVSLQNGMGNVETLEAAFGQDRVLGGVTAEGATLLGPGHVRHAGQGDTIIGGHGSGGGRLQDIIGVFTAAGFQTQSAEDVDGVIWGKLVVNVGINALTAITRLKNGRLPAVEGTRTLMDEAVAEAAAVAEAKGVRLPYPEPAERVSAVCRATAENVASMLQDVLNHRVTEVDFINGAVVREGRALGIPTPVNFTLTCLVQAIQETYEYRVDAA